MAGFSRYVPQPDGRLCGTGAVFVSLLKKHQAQAGPDQDLLGANFIQILSNSDTCMAV